MVAGQAMDGCDRSWRYAQHAHLGRRPFSTIMIAGHWSIFAWRSVRSRVFDGSLIPPTTSAARADSWCFHPTIYLGSPLNCSAKS